MAVEGLAETISQEDITAACDALPLCRVILSSLSTRTTAALLRHNPNMTVGQLMRQDDDLAVIRGIGALSLAEIAQATRSLLVHPQALAEYGISISHAKPAPPTLERNEEHSDAHGGDGPEHGNGEAQAAREVLPTSTAGHMDPLDASARQQNKVVPDIAATSPDGLSATERLSYVQDALQAVLIEGRANKDLWMVIRYRFGLEGREQRTLDEISRALGVTRERVRQKEKQALELIACAMRYGHVRKSPIHLHPFVQHDLRALLDLFEDMRPALREDALFVAIGALLGCPQTTDPASTIAIITPWRTMIAVLLAAVGYTPKELYNTHLWLVMSRAEQDRLVHQIKALHQYLTTKSILPCPPVEALMDLNAVLPRNEHMARETLETLIPLCGSIETTIDLCIQAKFEWLEGRPNQVERVLYEQGKPLSLDELAREINHRLVPHGHKKVGSQNLGNQLRGHEHIVTIGRSGLWGLRQWGNITTATIVQLMEEYLITRNTPATADDIFTYVSARRPVEHTSISIYLSERPEFRRMGLDRWGLATWKRDPDLKTWDEQEVAALVAAILKEQRVREVAYASIKEALAYASGLTERQAQGKLNQNRMIKVRRDQHGARFVSLLPAGEQRRRRPYVRKKATLMLRVADQARLALEQAPDHELSLEQLFHTIGKTIACPKPTLYSYISRVSFIEKTTNPETRRKYCRLIGPPSPTNPSRQ